MVSLSSLGRKISRLLLYEFTNLLTKSSENYKKNSILLYFPGGLGDYVLFRNFIKYLHKSNKFAGYQITLLGNVVFRELCEGLDSNYINSFIWVDFNRFFNDLKYRFKKLIEIKKHSYDFLIVPTYRRDFMLYDSVARVVRAREKISTEDEYPLLRKFKRILSKKIYTKLIVPTSDMQFIFYRYKEFIENLIEEKIDITKPHIETFHHKLNYSLPQKYAVLFIGASSRSRKWRIDGYAKVARYLNQSFNYDIVLCGDKEDERDAEIFMDLYGKEFVNLVGKTTIFDLMEVLRNSQLIISNETSVPHIAVALNCKNIFTISNGNSIFIHIPYPEDITKSYYPIFHPVIENLFKLPYEEISSNEKVIQIYKFGSKLNIDDITPEMVINKISQVLVEGTRTT